MNVLEPSSRLLFRAALVIFVITILIGMLNGLDIWEPSHPILMTHVHSGTLGWITLAVIGAALLMFGDAADTAVISEGRTVAVLSVAAAALYVVAFATGTGIFRPIAGTFMLVAIVWVLVWVARRYGASARSTAQLGILLAMISLTIGAVLGVLLGLFIAQGSIPGLDLATAASFAGAHPPAMLIGYLVLAGAAVIHWLLSGSETWVGRAVMWMLFAGGVVVNLAFILDIEVFVQVATVLEVVAIVAFVVHMWPHLRPAAWAGGGLSNFARVSAVFLVIGIGLLIDVVRLIVSGEMDPATGAGPVHVLLAFDHVMFIGVMTNALFALVGPADRPDAKGSGPVLWAVNTGLVVFVVGLVLDTAVLKRIGAPLMGLALLYAIVWFLKQMGTSRVVAR